MRLVGREEIPALWHEARQKLLPAIERSGRFYEQDILAGLLNYPEVWQLWLHENAALITHIVNYSAMRICEIYFAGGEKLETWEQYEPMLCAWAKGIGCKKIEATGREGWVRKAHPGWKQTAVRLTKEL